MNEKKLQMKPNILFTPQPPLLIRMWFFCRILNLRNVKSRFQRDYYPKVHGTAGVMVESGRTNVWGSFKPGWVWVYSLNSDERRGLRWRGLFSRGGHFFGVVQLSQNLGYDTRGCFPPTLPSHLLQHTLMHLFDLPLLAPLFLSAPFSSLSISPQPPLSIIYTISKWSGPVLVPVSWPPSVIPPSPLRCNVFSSHPLIPHLSDSRLSPLMQLRLRTHALTHTRRQWQILFKRKQ